MPLSHEDPQLASLLRQLEVQAEIIGRLSRNLDRAQARIEKSQQHMDRLTTAAGVIHFRLDERKQTDLVVLAQYVSGLSQAVARALGIKVKSQPKPSKT